MRLSDQVAIVTGAGNGIGQAITRRFAEEGAHIAVFDINPDDGAGAVRMVESLHRRSLFVKADVSDSASVQRAIQQTLAHFGKIDILVNNAGINVAKRVVEYTDEDWRRILGVNLDGVWFCCRYVIPHFLDRGKGVIVNIASVGAFQTSHDRAPYMASKGGVVSLTKALALDLAENNIRVNAIAPGIVETTMSERWKHRPGALRSVTFLTPMGRFGRPEEIANAAVFLASGEASFVTGHTLTVDGGMTAGNHFGRHEMWVSADG
jgi:NAD(P)-dependent dehydrogenase (short-subunit alcohol dehydrogenase family)